MLWKIYSFELYYRLNRPATYIYFAVVFLIVLLTITSPTVILAGAVGNVHTNSPYVISAVLLVFSVYMTIVSSAIIGVAVVRDYDHGFAGILFTTRLRKLEYLMGRFLGSFTIMMLVALAAVLGLIAGYLLGEFLPWQVVWKFQTMLPFDSWHYLQPFLVLMCSNLFISSAFFFMSGALGRSAIVIYTQGILLLLLYQTGSRFLQTINPPAWMALMDPFGIQAFIHTTQYWSPVEKNTLLVPFEGMILYNRILWILIGGLALLVTYASFSFKMISSPLLSNRRAEKESNINEPVFLSFPRITLYRTLSTPVRQVIRGAWLYFKMISREIAFIAIVIGGLLAFFIKATKIDDMYGTSSYPTTYAILDLFNSFNTFFFIIAVFYSGELLWTDRRLNFHHIADVLPVSDFVTLMSKFLGLVLIYVLLLSILLISGLLVQVAYGYYLIDFPVFAGTLFLSTLSFVGVITLLSFFIQSVINNKFLGFVICTALIVSMTLLKNAGVESDLLLIASGDLPTYSDMNKYGHFLWPFVWIRTYWLSFSAILFLMASLFWVRGTDSTRRNQWKEGMSRFTPPLQFVATITLSVFILSGLVIYYNTRIVNQFQGSYEKKKMQAGYEKELQKYNSVIQPKVVGVSLAVDLFPAIRDFYAKGSYDLKNKSSRPITEIHIQLNKDSQVITDSLTFDRKVTIKESHEAFRYFIYTLETPLAPGDSVKLNFKVSFNTQGFELRGSNTQVVENGTFIDQSYFPSVGYQSSHELMDKGDREEHGLSKKDFFADRPDEEAEIVNHFDGQSDRIRFEAVVSTEPDQSAVAPGRLLKTWESNKRRYFKYSMESPMPHFYSILTGRYQVSREKYGQIDLEIYHHPEHPYNVDRMMKGMKDALAYCSENYGPYQNSQLRIVEFPRYTSTARSFGNIIPFSEGNGFIFNIRDPSKDLDMAYYMTAHEVAHHWWGHQLMEAHAKGGPLLSEGLAQYAALMIMNRNTSREMMERYLRYELKEYLTGRSLERQNEPPLTKVERQRYLYYHKASLAFFALQDYIGEDKLNQALQSFNNVWAYREPPYPTATDLLNQMRKVTPDTLQYLIGDLFENITLFENKATEAMYEEITRGKFEVTLKIQSEKLWADSLGHETAIPLNDWMDIGIYSQQTTSPAKLIYLRKHKITRKEEVINIIVNERPGKAGIDPLHKLIDRHADDNTIKVTRFVELSSVPIY